MATKNLWGDLSGGGTVRTPVVLLKEQAEHLTSATNKILQGHVYRFPLSKYPFSYNLDIRAPLLEGYSYSLLRVEYDLSVYPAYITNLKKGEQIQVPDEAAFEVALGRILSSDATKFIIEVLLSQSRGIEKS